MRFKTGQLAYIENNVGTGIGVKVKQNLLKCGVGIGYGDLARAASHIEQSSLLRC